MSLSHVLFLVQSVSVRLGCLQPALFREGPRMTLLGNGLQLRGRWGVERRSVVDLAPKLGR